MFIKCDMYASISCSRKEIPTVCGDLIIGISILGGTQTDIGTDTGFKSDEIQRTTTHTEITQVVLQHQRDFGIMQP